MTAVAVGDRVLTYRFAGETEHTHEAVVERIRERDVVVRFAEVLDREFPFQTVGRYVGDLTTITAGPPPLDPL